MAKRTIPFPFIIENLSRLPLTIKSFFGCHALYLEDKILIVMRHKKEHSHDNGVWIATFVEHHASLKEDFPNMRSIELFGQPPTSWQNLPVEADDFEESVNTLCDLILKNDPRIGRIPAKRKKQKAK